MNKNNDKVSAQIIKSERLKRKMTLEEVADGICSISFLSKLENNMVRADEGCVRRICEKMDLNFEHISPVAIDAILESIIECHIIGDIDEIKSITSNVDTSIPYIGNLLIELFQLITLKDYDKLEVKFHILGKLKNHFDETEVALIEYLKAFSLFNRKNYRKALLILKDIKCEKISSKLKICIFDALVNCAFHTNDVIVHYIYIDKLNKLIDLGYPIKKRIVIEQIKYYFECEYNYIEILEQNKQFIQNKNNSLYRNDVDYFTALIHIKNGRYKDAITFIDNITYTKHTKFLALYILAKKKMNEKFKLSDELYSSLSNNEHKKFIDFCIKYLDKDTVNIDEYKMNYIEPLESIQHYFYDQVYVNYYAHILEEASRYKEIVRLYKN